MVNVLYVGKLVDLPAIQKRSIIMKSTSSINTSSMAASMADNETINNTDNICEYQTKGENDANNNADIDDDTYIKEIVDVLLEYAGDQE